MCLCSSLTKELRKKIKDDESYKPLPQKHSLVSFDRELFEQISLELEVPILEVAKDNNATCALMDIDDQDVRIANRKPKAYEVLQNGENLNTYRRASQSPKYLLNNQGRSEISF